MLRPRMRRKNYRIDLSKLEQARRILGSRSETETIHRALDPVAHEVALAKTLHTHTFVLKSRGHIEDVDAPR